MQLGVIGLGKLGLVMATLYASRGYDVVGVDGNEWMVNEIKEGRCPIEETGLKELLGRCKGKLQVSTLYNALSSAEIVFIIVPTPSENGRFTNKYVLSAVSDLGKVIKETGCSPLVVVTSTVMPGSMAGVIKPMLEEIVGKECKICYNPEFIALGSVIRDMEHPDSILIGESDREAGGKLQRFYIQFHRGNTPPICRMSLWNAELAKLSLNIALTTKISMINSIANMCERMPEGNVREVAQFIGLDSRIGSKFMQSGVGYGGTCVVPTTLVQTSKGLKPIKNVAIGDLVLSHDGYYHTVSRRYCRYYEGDLVEITPEGFPQSPILLTPEHPIWSAKRLSEYKGRFRNVKVVGNRQPMRLNHMIGHLGLNFMPANSLQQGDILAMPILQNTSDVIPKIKLRTHHKSFVKPKTQMTPELMRLFGFYIAEGSTWRKEITFSFHRDEEYYYEDIRNIMKKYFGVKTTIHARKGKGIRTRTTCSPLADYLRDTFGRCSYKKHFPQDWLYLPNAYLTELIRGIWYGDGSNSDDGFTLGVASRDLSYLVRLVLLKLQIPHSTKENKAHVGGDGTYHRASYYISIENPIYIRKFNDICPLLALENNRRGKRTLWCEDGMMQYHIRKIRSVPYKGLVNNLEVEYANSYAVESGVLHNCLPRDNRAFIEFAKDYFYDCPMQEAVDDVNDFQVENAVRRIRGMKLDGTISVLGLTYKPTTPIVEESKALELARKLSERYKVKVYDPMGMENARKELGDAVEYCDSMKECVKDSDMCVVATAWEEFKQLHSQGIMKAGATIYDCCHMFDRRRVQIYGLRYCSLGVNE